MGDEASGGDFNPCECIWNHEMAMRRLLNFLRNSQALCTDTECIEPGLVPPERANPPENFYIMSMCVIGLTLFLILFRPRQRVNDSMIKPANENNSNNTPPAPPIN